MSRLVSMRLPESLVDWLDAEASRKGVSRTQIVSLVLRAHLAQQAQAERAEQFRRAGQRRPVRGGG